MGSPGVQQLAGVAEGAPVQNVPPTQQVAQETQETGGQEVAPNPAAQSGVAPPARPTEDTPETREAYGGELRNFLNASVATQPQEVADAMRAVFGGFRQVSDVASALMNARNGLIERHRESFGVEPDAAALPACLGRMDRLLDRPDYQLVLHSAPFHGDGAQWRHWFIEILPVLASTGGFEHATGCRINTVFPEEATP